MTESRSRSHVAILIGILALATSALSQGNREAEGLSREQMWRAATAEEWKKPVLIEFQRTWEDALAISKETGKPILICINMDGEIASEHYAGIRYRSKEIAPLYEPYVCVIASVYRHNPRDHDDQGNRILCPRFGSVTCGEHIWIEPIIYEKYCDGERVAPRHICISLEGKEIYDVYYVDDTAGVFDSIRDGRKKLPPGKPPIVRGDRPILERVASRHIADRNAVEKAYKSGDATMRNSLLEAAIKNGDSAQIDLMRLAIFGLDVEASRTARRALSEVKSIDASELISDALQVPMDAKERDALIATLKRLGGKSVRAQWLAGVHGGLSGPSTTIKVEAWGGEGAARTAPRPDAYVKGGKESHIEEQAKAAYERPKDPQPRIEFAEANLAMALQAPRVYAMNPRIGRRVSKHMYGAARQAATEAQKLGATGWRLNAVLALSAYYSGDREEGYKHAAAAMKDLPAGDQGWASMAVVTIFAESRWKAIRAAVKDQKDWPTEWLSDLHAAYTVLLRHPLGTDGQVVWHYELLDWLGARYRAWRVLHEGIARFRDSARLHEKYRERLLKYRGPRGLEDAYDRMLEQRKDPARLAPFAGVASIEAALNHRRKGENAQALEAYGRAIEHYEAALAAAPGNKREAVPAIALALSGRARVYFELKDDANAVKNMIASFTRDPDAAGTKDGMGHKPGETAQIMLARLKKEKKDDLAKQLAAALSKIDPELLIPDEG